MKFISDVSKDIILLAQQEPFWMVQDYTFLHDFCFYGTIHPPKSHTICFFLANCQNPFNDFLFLWGKKEKKKWKLHWLDISVTVCLQRPLQFQLKLWLAAGNSHKEEPSSVLETRCHPDETTMQQHILNDVVILSSKNGKKSRKQRISECITWYIIHVETLLNCYPAY